MATGPVVDQLAADYSGQNVVFIEYDVDAPLGNRLNQFFASAGGGSLPLAMTDSGFGTHMGYEAATQYNHLKALVDTAIARSPMGQVSGMWQRIGNHVRFTVWVTNNSGVTLSASNIATIHGIVYEDVQTQIHYTNRWGRVIGELPISNLPNGASGSFTIDTPDLPSGTDWSRLHSVAVVDYRPGGWTGPFDVINAARMANNMVYLPLTTK